MFCTKCGKELREGDLFCFNCGTKVSSTENNSQTENLISNPNDSQVDGSNIENKPLINKDISMSANKKKIVILLSAAVGISLILLITTFSVLIIQSKAKSSVNTIADVTVSQEPSSTDTPTMITSPSAESDEHIEQSSEKTTLDEFKGLGEATILKMIDDAYIRKYDVMMGYLYDVEPTSDGFYPMSSEFNTYEKIDLYLSNNWAKGYALVFLNEFSYCMRRSSQGYYIAIGDIGWTPDILSGKVVDISQVDNLIKVSYSCLDTDDTYFTDIAWFIKEDDGWKMTTLEVGKIERSDIKMEEISLSKDNDNSCSLDINKARDIAMKGYPSYINWSEGIFDEDTYGNPAYVFNAYDPNIDEDYAVFVRMDGTYYAHI